jgi:hypothetical protein
MAFHPFRWFRKHQKVIWGFLVVLCMITFVFMSGTGGRGDIFDRLVQMVRGRRGTTPVTQLYGATIDTRQLQDLKQERRLARVALQTALQVAGERIQKDLNELNAEPKKGIEPKDIAANFQKRQELQSKQQALMFKGFAYQMEDQTGARTQTDGLLDFMVWQHQADKLGIQLTEDDISAELRRTTSDLAGLNDVLPLMLRSGQLTQPQVVKALGDEFRVQLAKETLLNYEPENPFMGQSSSPLKQVPAPVTPYEFWKYFEKERTAVDVALVKVPVDVPSSQGPLTGQDDREIQAMYSRYKDQEARPDQAQPGFKVPRRVKVGWVTARPDSEYYHKLAGDVAKLAYFLRKGLAPATALPNGLPTAVQSLLPALHDPAFLVGADAHYDIMKRPWGDRRFEMAGLAQADFPLSVYTTRVHAEDPASLVGALATGQGPLASLSGLTAYQVGAYQRNAKDKDLEALVAREIKEKRIPYGVSLLGFGADTAGPLPLQAGLTLAALTAYGNDAPQYIPPEAPVIHELVEQTVLSGLAVELADANLRAFQKDLDRERTRGANAEERAKSAADWIAKGVEKYHLEAMPKPMAEARDRYDLPKAPALEPLQEALRQRPGTSTPEQIEKEFTDTFLQGQGDYDPKVWPPGASLGGDQGPQQFGPRPADRDVFLVWRTEDKAAYVPPFDQMKDEVTAAWRLQKARIATGDEAEKLKEELGKTGGDIARVRQLAAEKKYEVRELRGVARKVPEPVPVPNQHRYQAYPFPSDIKYPGADWVNEMVDKLKNKGDTIVLADRPEKAFYVAVLLDRIEPSVRTFHDVYKEMAQSPTNDQLLQEYLREREMNYRQDFVTRLRIEAGAGPDGRFKFTPEYLKMQEGRGGEE